MGLPDVFLKVVAFLQLSILLRASSADSDSGLELLRETAAGPEADGPEADLEEEPAVEPEAGLRLLVRWCRWWYRTATRQDELVNTKYGRTRVIGYPPPKKKKISVSWGKISRKAKNLSKSTLYDREVGPLSFQTVPTIQV